MILSIANMDGTPVSESHYKKCGLAVGDSLKSTFETETDTLLPFRQIESFWRKKMGLYEPTVFHRQRMNVVAGILDISTEINLKTVKLCLPRIKSNSMYECKDTFLYACFVTFLARINCTSDIHIGMIADKTKLPKVSWPLYSDITPGVFEIDLNDSVEKNLKDCSTKLKTHQTATTFLIDIFYRYPELRGQKRIPHHNIVIGKKNSYLKESVYMRNVVHDCNMLLLFNEDNSSVELLYHERSVEDLSHIVDVLRHFPSFLEAISGPNRTSKLQEISLIQEDEMNKFYQVHQPDHPEPNENLIGLVQQQCMLTPLSIALKTTTHMYTYKKMAEEISQMQNTLVKCLPQLENKEIIALHLPNSIAYVVSLLAVVGCNKAFLPLPVDMPPERILFMLKDAKVQKMIMTKEKVEMCDLNWLPATMRTLLRHNIADKEIVLVDFSRDNNGNRCGSADHENAKNLKDVEDFSYVMYTSGSTGRPKGVKVKGSSIINLARAQTQIWDLGPGDIIAQFASIGFDASISEIFTSILSGASLALLGEKERLGSDFTAAMAKMKVTVITLPPSVLNIYSPKDLPTFMKVVSAGEACTLNTAIKWTSSQSVRFFNAYGPTECTVCATCHEYIPGTHYENVNRELPIGKAIDGVQIYLFDDFMSPVPPGVVGEIYIGGKGLAHGYIGHASNCTRDRFIQNPLTTKASKLYKTGDHAFQDNHGNITFIGRLDSQVKLRGHKIDLSEIEQVLNQYPKIDFGVVVVHKCSSRKERSIAAFIAPKFINLAELREYLSKSLPRYMMPTFIKKMDISEVPTTLNGKVNRKLLETDETIHEAVRSDEHSHLNETQLLVAKHWCTVFKLDQSSINSLHMESSFSELGGDSLHLVLLLRLIEDELKMSISFTDLGTSDTIEEFAEFIKRCKDMESKHKLTNKKTKEELRELIFHDSELDSSFFPSPERRSLVKLTNCAPLVPRYSNLNCPQNVLLSGVTGFLGAFLLSELLEQTNAHVFCMVRETSEARGMRRLVGNMRKYKLWKFEYTPRLTVVISDLSGKHMGIAPDIYKSLCNAIDVVFMNAAAMNFNTAYEDHRIPNVQGTKEFIKFASTGVWKYLFTTSSLGVFLFPQQLQDADNSSTGRRVCTEAEFFDDPMLIESGYGQSKWASERLVRQALDVLPGGAIFRPARVSGRGSDGVGPTDDIFASILRGIHRLGCYPDMDFPFDLVPVDFCAKSMIEITLKICNARDHTPDMVYHLYNTDTLPFNCLFNGMGLRPCSLSEWRHVLRNAPEDNKELIPLTPFFMSEFWDKAPSWPVFDTSNTDKTISDEAKQLLKPSTHLLEVYKNFFQISNLIGSNRSKWK